jgi:SNF2 family DNA or RNA helicase
MTAERKSLEPYLKDEVEYYPHQVEGIRVLARLPSFLLADDMGLGKSLQALTVFCIDAKMGKAETLVIVAPLTLRENWADEIEKFTRIPYTLWGEEVVGVMRKKLTPARREAQLKDFIAQKGPRILITHYEQWVGPMHEETMKKTVFSAAIFDESHRIKNPKSQRTKAAMRIRSHRSFMLSGTPMLNQVDELWTTLNRINPTKFPRYWTFVNRYCLFGGYQGKAIVGSKNTKELNGHLKDIMLRRMKDDVLSRDKPTYVQVKVGLSDEQRKLYDTLMNDLLLVTGTGEEEIGNALTKFLRAKQICCTPSAVDPSMRDSSDKMDQVIEDLLEITSGKNAEKAIVFTQFRGVLESLERRWRAVHHFSGGPNLYQLHGGVPQDQRVPVVNAWSNDGQPSVIACMTQVAGVGLNMVAARQVLFIDKLFVPGLNKQAVDRADRIGQNRPVIVREYIAKGTVEDRIEQILRTKSKEFGNIIESAAGQRSLAQKLLEALRNQP